MSGEPLEFYFDFNSPYGYVGAHLIDNIAERYDRTTDWHPILLGVAFEKTGAKPMNEIPIKGPGYHGLVPEPCFAFHNLCHNRLA